MKSALMGLVLGVLTFAHSPAYAKVCITEIHGSSARARNANDVRAAYESIYQASAVFFGSVDPVLLSSLSCKKLNRMNSGVQATAMVLTGIGIYGACTGFGLPATVALEGGALALTGLSLIISNIDCVDAQSEAHIKEKVDGAVCEALKAQGIGCRPPLQN